MYQESYNKKEVKMKAVEAVILSYLGGIALFWLVISIVTN